MVEKIDQTENPLDTFINLIDISGVAGSSEAIERQRFRPIFLESAFPEDAFAALGIYEQNVDNEGGQIRAKEAAHKFEEIMGFSIESLHKRVQELEDRANANQS